MHVPGKMQIYVLHGQNLGIAAAGRAAFYAEYRPQRGFPQGNNRLFPDFGHSFSQTGGCGRLSLTGRGGVDRRHEDQLSVLFPLQAGKQLFIQLCLIAAIGFQLFLLNAKTLCNLCNGL